MNLEITSNLQELIEQANSQPLPVVIDTNMVLDMLLFDVPEAKQWLETIQMQKMRWLATAKMREELKRVLSYPQILARVHSYDNQVSHILQNYDNYVQTMQSAPRSSYVCKDKDDQCFIDLAVAHKAVLLSKDTQVAKLRKRLAKIGVMLYRQW